MNQTKTRFDARNYWRRLPIRAKVLIPIALAGALALGVIGVGVQAPIDTLTQNSIAQGFTVQNNIYSDRLAHALTTYGQNVADLANSASVTEFASALANKDQGQTPTNVLVNLNFEGNLSNQMPYDSLRYLSNTGEVLSLVTAVRTASRVETKVVPPESLNSEGVNPYFRSLMLQLPGKSFVLPLSAPSPDASNKRPSIQIGVPVYQTGTAVGAVVASYDAAKFLNGLLDTSPLIPYQALLAERTGTILAATDPSNNQRVAVLGADTLPKLQIPSRLLGGANEGLIDVNGVLYNAIAVGDASNVPANTWTLIVSQDRNTAFAGANNIRTTLYGTLIIVFILIGSGSLYYLNRTVTQPLAVMTRAATRLAQGNLQSDIPALSGDEFGQLATAFNTMGKQLSEVVTSLESRVAERTRNIEIAAEISRDAAAIRDINELLWRAVNAIQDRFNFYHVQVFLLNDTEDDAVLITSTGEAGKTLLARNHKLAVGSDSLIGQTTARARTFITLDTKSSDVPHRFNPILPDTRSEMAVPMRVSGKVIGALDVQSIEPDAFTQDHAQIFEVLADQLAIAIDNARLLEESNRRLQQVAELNQQLTRSSWDEFIAEEKPIDLGFNYDLLNVKPATLNDQPASASADIKVRGETVGSLSVQTNELSEDDTAILQAVADRVALAIENTRLVQQTRTALSKVEQLYQASRTFSSIADLQDIYRIAVSQLTNFDFLDRIIFAMSAPDPVPDAPYLQIGHLWEREPSGDDQLKTGSQLPRQQFPLASFASLDRRAIAFEIDTEIVNFPDLHRSLKKMGVQSGAVALLATTNRWFGVLVCHSNRPHAFNESFLQFLSAFGDQITATLENQYLLGGLQTEARRNRALAEAAQISSQIGIEFETGVTNLFHAVAGPAEYDRWWFGQLVGVAPENALVRVSSHFGEGSPLHTMARIALDSDENTIAEAVRIGEWVLVNDPTEHHALSKLSREKMWAFGKHIAVPVTVGNTIVGALMVGRDVDQTDLDDRDVQLAITLANQVSVVLENRRLFASAETERQTLQAVLDSLPTGVLVIDAKSGDISLTNELARTLLGLDEDAPYQRVHAVDDIPYEPDEFPPVRVLKTLEPVISEDMTVIRNDGERIDLLINAAPVTDQNGEVISAVAVFQDVSDLRELENVLQDSLRETTSLYETTRAISAETDLVSILNVVTNQIIAVFAPFCVYANFADDDGNIIQTFGSDLVNHQGISEITGTSPLPTSILVKGEIFTESDILQNPELSNDPQLTALGVQSVATFPFNVRSRTVGWLIIGFDEPRALTPEERRLVGTLADQAAVAVENARLAEQTAQALSETTLLYEASYTINRATSIEDALGIMRDQVKYFAPTQIDIFLAVTRYDTTSIDWAVHWNANDPSTHSRVELSSTRTVDETVIQADPYFVDNVGTATPEQLQLMHLMPELEDFRAQTAVSLVVGGLAIGRLVVSFNRPYRFGRLERQFITTLIDQAAIVINNNMLVQQTQDSLDETATLYQSSRAITDAPDLSQVLTAIIEYAAPPNINRASLITLTTDSWDAPDVAIEIAADWERDGGANLTGTRLTPDQYPAWNVIASPEITWIDDVATNTELDATSRNLYQNMGIVAVVSVPLATGGKPAGSLVFSSSEPWLRTEREVRIFSSLADQAAISIVNRRLLRQTERRARQLQISAQIAQAATSILNLDELFNQTVYLVKDGFGYDHAQIFLISADGLDAQLVASTGEPGRQLLEIRHHLLVGSSSVIGRVTSTGNAQIVSDTADPRAVHKPNPYLPNTRAEMALPLKARNRILGALDVQSNAPGAFTEEDVRVLSNLADQIAVAIDNARLFEVSEQRVDEMQFLFDVTRSATVALEETETALKNIARQIKDNLQAAAAAVLLLDETATKFTSYSFGDLPIPTELLDPARSVFKQVLDSGEALIANDLAHTVSPIPGLTAAIVVPLNFADRPIGVLALKSQFLANMSHELRTPLNSIIGFSRVILKGIDGPLTDMQEQDLGTIHESGKHLLNLVNDILDQAKIEAGKMELSYSFFSMGELVKSVMSTAVGLVKDKPVRLHQEIEGNLPQVWGDEFRSRQVLLNLVSNAAKFTAQGGVTVSAFRIHENDSEMVQVSVTDTGIGIPQDKLGAVFEAFQQAENTTARQYEGTGLGLPIAKSLIEMQGGTISVISEVGIGSTFSFTIPINAPEPVEEAPEQPLDSQLASQVSETIEQAEAPQHVHRIILAIDDELGMVNLYRRYLANSGYEVIGGSPEEAEELAIAYQPRLILLDINMPNRSGWDVLAHLKDRDETFEIPVIICSIDSDQERAFRLGAADYLLKSIDEQTLVEAVKRVEIERDRRKVLIIDDQPESIRLVRDAIGADERFVIIEAIGGEQGLDMINNHWPDLIILDLRMPDMDGFEVLDKIRAIPDAQNIPVIVVTADDLTEEEHARLGNTCVYRKQTVDAKDLLENVVAQLTW